jgi:cobalt/nickel transport system permease protein
MHLPDGLIPLDQVFIYWLISLIALAMFFFRLSKDKNQKDKRIILTGILSAATIIGSSISVPSPFGIPMHFFLIPLVVIILGPLNGILVAFLSLSIQAFFGLGGLTVLGVNVFVLGVVLCLSTHIFYTIFSKFNEEVGVFTGTVVGILLATVAHFIILLFAGRVTLEILLFYLLIYSFIGVIEGFVNAFIIQFIEKIKPEILNLKKI